MYINIYFLKKRNHGENTIGEKPRGDLDLKDVGNILTI